MTTSRSNVCVSDGPADATESTRSAEGPFVARNGCACPTCGCADLIIVKGYIDMFEACDFDPTPDREGIERHSTDWEYEPEKHLLAHACPKCRKVVNGSEWCE